MPRSTAPVLAAPRPARVPTLDGLRAIAVLLVVAYHVAPVAVPSGLLGVDVFFVLSGYLITSGLLRERARGRVDLVGFWRRRARRILPPLLLLLLVIGTLLLIVRGDASVRFGAQLLSGLGFVSNWAQISSGEDYFAQHSPPVLQNLWSLAVEEQFYLVWPLVLLVILWAARRRAGPVVALLAAASLAGGQFTAGALGLSRAYFGTDTHGFGLLAGAALALLVRHRTSVRRTTPRGQDRAHLRGSARAPGGRAPGAEHSGAPTAVLPTLAVLGVVALVAIAVRVPEQTAFLVASPLAVMLTCAVILGCRTSHRLTAPLAARPLVAIGVRSYGIYLWHWPLLVIARQVIPGGAPAWAAPTIGVTASVAAAWVSWSLLESPILRDGLRGLGAVLRPVRTRRGRATVAAVIIGAVTATVTAAAVAPNRTEAEQQIAVGRAVAGSSSADPDGSADRPSSPSAPSRSPTGTEEDTTELPSDDAPVTTNGQDILAIGDSVMLASSPALIEQFPGIRIDAAVSRMPQEAPGILRDLADAGELRPTVVIGLGTNGLYSPQTLHEIRAIVGEDRTLVLVSVYADRSWQDGVNDEVGAFAEADPRTLVADWHDVIASHTDGLGADHVHPTSDGAEIYADCLAATLTDARARNGPDRAGGEPADGGGGRLGA
ncbi:acetyltransferase [Brachybacterium alimentarium]|uniref:acyltransferase family protein n=1 Tax=Brachybacterium alimentarium TaxID=47845 RepID=UPI000DF428D9|nr:acyltransferase family protein [Brachybacterium alimentarium]RCS93539.1 acetyltransferase [Brachybacterium alimentarium]